MSGHGDPLRVDPEAYRLLAENTSDVICRTDAEGRFEWISPSMHKRLGWDPTALLGTRMVDLVTTEDRPRITAVEDAVRAGGEIVEYECRFLTVDGGSRWLSVNAHPVRDAAGGVVAAVITLVDVDREVRAREDASRREERYRLVAEHALDIVVLGPLDRPEWISPAVTELLGHEPAELVRRSLLHILHPEDLALARERRAGVDGGVVEGRYRLRDRDGRWHWFEARGRSLPEDGRSLSVWRLVAAADGGGHDAHTSEVASAGDQAERARATLDSLFDPHVVLEARRGPTGEVVDLVYVDANAAACASLHRSHRELAGSLVSEVLNPEIAVGTARLVTGVFETGETLALDEVELPLPATDGQRRYDVRAVRHGSHVGITWRDVTERHEAAKQVAESEQQYRRLSEQLEDLLAHGSVLAVRARSDGELVWVSRSVGRLLGYDPVACLGHHVQDWVHPSDLPKLGHARSSLSADGTPMPLQLRLLTSEGSHRTFDGMAFRADDIGGRRELFQVTMADVTDRVQASRLREQLVAVASHELRSPLAFISGSLRLFEAGVVTPDSERGRELLLRVTATSERLARIADSLLRLQNLELTDIVMPSDVVELVQVVSDAASTVPLERGVSVVCTSMPEGELWWRADADEITQAVVNLAVNAVKHSPDGARVDVSLTAPAGVVRLCVRDRGSGVAAEHRQAVFEAFHQLERSDRSGGVGLGLAIVAKIAERHAGRVWVEEPADGPGACFVLELGHVPPPFDP